MSIFKNWFTLQIELNLAVLRLAEGKKKKKNIRGGKMSPAK